MTHSKDNNEDEILDGIVDILMESEERQGDITNNNPDKKKADRLNIPYSCYCCDYQQCKLSLLEFI